MAVFIELVENSHLQSGPGTKMLEEFFVRDKYTYYRNGGKVYLTSVVFDYPIEGNALKNKIIPQNTNTSGSIGATWSGYNPYGQYYDVWILDKMDMHSPGPFDQENADMYGVIFW